MATSPLVKSDSKYLRQESPPVPDVSAARPITVELAVYAGVFGVALFLRLFRLGLAPLSESEAAQAVAALKGAFPPAGGSPLLYSINSFLMSLFSPGDAIVRFVPAVIGSLVVLAPALFRGALGRFGALGASIVLCLSPLAIVASRTLNSEVIVVACVLITIALVRRYRATGDDRNLIGGAVALGIGLASGPGMYTALLAFGASYTVLRVVLGDDSEKSESRRPESPLAVVRARRSLMAGSLIGAFALTATGGLTNLAGLGAAGDLLTSWLRAFSAPGGSSRFDMFLVLIVYESLALLAGSIGLFRSLRQKDRFGAWLGFTVIAGVLIVTLQSGRQPIDLLLPVTLLALLAGHLIQPWAEDVRSRSSLATDGVVLAVGVAVTAFLYLALTSFVRNRLPAVTLGASAVQPYLVLAGLIVLVPVALAALLATLYDTHIIRRALTSVGLIVLALGSFGAGWGAAQARVGDPHEIVLGSSTTSTDIRGLVHAAEQIAIRTQGHIATLPVRVDVDDPVVTWYLRDARWTGSPAPPGVVTSYGSQLQSGGVSYIGARFITSGSWDTLGLNIDAWLEWVIFRTSPALPPTLQAVTLWEKR